MTQNEVFKRTPIEGEPRRYKLPVQKNPNEKLKIWSLIKDSIGKDLSKFAVPGNSSPPSRARSPTLLHARIPALPAADRFESSTTNGRSVMSRFAASWGQAVFSPEAARCWFYWLFSFFLLLLFCHKKKNNIKQTINNLILFIVWGRGAWLSVYLNEPLSMLQRMAEQMIFSHTLDSANNAEDSCIKLGYVMGFAISVNSFQNDRKKKPFNPLLGETHEYFDEKSGIKMISEQVSHHPPISAMYAENQNFRFWNNSNIKTSFWGKSLEIRPVGINTIILKKGNVKITFNKPITCVQNIIFGNMYIDNYGEMKFTNHTTGESGVLHLTERSWNGKGAFEVNGCIKDKQGVEQYKIKGRWDSHLVAYNIKTNQETLLWKFDMKFPPNHEYYYNFSEYAINLNYLNYESLKKIPQTDSRLRPDQRALEYGLIEMATSEKARLEEKQRARRKEYQQKNKEHVPQWFEEQVDKDTQEKEFIYKGGYWEAREKGEFGELLDIY